MSLQEQYQPQQHTYRPLEQTQIPPEQLYFALHKTCDEVSVGKIDTITNAMSKNLSVEFILEPVYVTEKNGKSVLVYDSRIMKENERYFVMWNGDPFALVREGDKVIIYEGQVIP